MNRQTGSENKIYLSSRLKKELDEISGYAVTAVTAPMGYGKSTAVGIFLQKVEQEGAIVMRQSIYGVGETLFWNGFVRMFGETQIYPELKELAFPKDENARAFFLELLENSIEKDAAEAYCFIDDLHLVQSKEVMEFLNWLIRYLPENLHLILASRNRIFSDGEKLRLGRRIKEIGADDLRLEKKDVESYSRSLGIRLSGGEIDILDRCCEGWFSAVYLNLIAYESRKQFMLDGTSIYQMIFEILVEPLPEEEKRLLTILGMADEFTIEQAVALWGDPLARQLLKNLVEKNAFISEIPEYGTLRCHHMLKVCTEKMFEELPEEERRIYEKRMGSWYHRQKQYPKALYWFSQVEDYEALLGVLEEDRGYALDAKDVGNVLKWSKNCPVEILNRHPQAILIFMRRLYTFQKIPEMMKMRGLFLECLEHNRSLSEQEKNNLLGESEIVMSFLKYNDIMGMSLHHRKACELMSTSSATMGGSGSWSFGSPSVLMMYYREPASLDKTVALMKECMPWYYRLTDGHGYGAEALTEAEAFLMRGQFEKMEIPLRRAEEMGKEKKQWGMLLCKTMLEMRLALFAGDWKTILRLEEEQRMVLKREGQSMYLNSLDLCMAFLCAVAGCPEEVPGWIARGEMESALVLFPAVPIMYAIYGQVLLAQKKYGTLLARKEEMRARYRVFPNLLSELYLEIQTAGACWELGEMQEAQEALKRAYAIGGEDEICLPFAENWKWIQKPLEACTDRKMQPFIQKIKTLGELLEKRKEQIQKDNSQNGLSDTEQQIARLAARRMSNREIGDQMGFSEGTVKQYLNRIYGKLGLEGNAADKRRRLKSKLVHWTNY